MRIALAALLFAVGAGSVPGLAGAAETATRAPAPLTETWDGEDSPMPLPMPPPPAPDLDADTLPALPTPGADTTPLPTFMGSEPVIPPLVSDPMPIAPVAPVAPVTPVVSSPVVPTSATVSDLLPASRPSITAATAAETPRRARVLAPGRGKVNIRSGPGDNFEIVTIAMSGTPLTVYAVKDNWHKIAYPAEELVSIPVDFVEAALPEELPETGVVGTIKVDIARLYVRHWDRSTVVGEVRRGDRVTIKRVRGDWFQILPPASARAYIHSDYVELLDTAAAPLPADVRPPENPNLPPPSQPGATGTVAVAGGRSRSGLTQEQEKARAAYLERIQRQWDQLIQEDDLEVRRAMEAHKNRITPLQELDAKLANIGNRSYGAVDFQPYRSPGVDAFADPADGGFTGWVEYIGRWGNRPAAFRLTKGGEIRFYLRSSKVRLEDYNFKRVWVNGFSETIPGVDAPVLVVEELRVLGEAPAVLRNQKVDMRFPDLGPVVDPRDIANSPVVSSDLDLGGTPVVGGGPSREELPAVIAPDVIPMGRSGMGASTSTRFAPVFPAVIPPTTPAFQASSPAAAGYVESAAPEGFGVVYSSTTTTTTVPTMAGGMSSTTTTSIEEYALPVTPSAPLPGGNLPDNDLPAYIGP